MNLQDVITMIEGGNMATCKSMLHTHCLVKDVSECLKEYLPDQHKITSKTDRPDKVIKNDDNVESIVKVARLPLAIQKKIVLVAASFLGNPEMQATPQNDSEKKLMKALLKLWDDNKLDYKFKSIAKKTMSELQAAELWFVKEAEEGYWTDAGVSGKFKLAMKVLSPTLGDTLYPVFDEFGDMVAFGRGYKIKGKDNNDIEHFDIYTAEKIYYSKNENGTWLFADDTKEYSTGVKAINNIIKKIPVIYYYQPVTEWADVQTLIERLEIIISNHADTNDYSGSPIVVASGEVEGFAKKGESGKVLIAKNGGKVEYLTYDSAPESIKMEIENLFKNIYSLTHTPDISFEQMKGLGVFTGVALKMLFLDAHLKAADKEELFGECIQRRINYIKAAMSIIDSSLKTATSLSIKPKFTYFLPKNYTEEVENLVKAYEGGIISKKTAISLNPLVTDVESELTQIGEEVEAQKNLPPKI